VTTVTGLRFAVNDKAYFTFDAVDYTLGNITIDIDWFSSLGNTTGAVKWEVAIACIVAGTGKVVKLPPKNPGPGENRLTVKYVRKIVKLAPQAVNQEVLISPYTSQCKLVSR
jgi:hypothetical protein